MATAVDARTAHTYQEEQLKMMKAQQRQQSLMSKLGLPLMLVAPWLAAKALPAMLLKMGMGAEKIAAITGMTQTAAGVGEAAKWTALPTAKMSMFAKHAYKPLVHGAVGSLPGVIASQMTKPLDLELFPRSGKSLPGQARDAARAGFLDSAVGQVLEQRQAAQQKSYLDEMREVMNLPKPQPETQGVGQTSLDSLKQASNQYAANQDWFQEARKKTKFKTSRYGGGN